jgi:hypothetical protein
MIMHADICHINQALPPKLTNEIVINPMRGIVRQVWPALYAGAHVVHEMAQHDTGVPVGLRMNILLIIQLDTNRKIAQYIVQLWQGSAHHFKRGSVGWSGCRTGVCVAEEVNEIIFGTHSIGHSEMYKGHTHMFVLT